MIGIEGLDAMRMGSDDGVRAKVDQPPCQFPLAVTYLYRVFLSPMREHQNKRSLPSGLGHRTRGAISIERGLVVRIVERDYRSFRAGSRLENHRLVRPRDGNVVCTQPGDRVQESLSPKIARRIVR